MSALAVDNARLYRDAREAVQARDDMMAVVSHDLGNPLSAIRIGTSLLLRVLPEESEHSGRQHVEAIRQSARQMENLVNDLLDVKRLETGSLPVAPAPLEAGGVVRDVVEVLHPIADSRTIRLETQCGPDLPPVMADYPRLVQVLSNLIGNALKFTGSGGVVVVRADAADGVVRFSVKDTGCGIAPEHLPHVFDRFWQVRRGDRAGLGLGLAIARGIVDAHGGQIWVESTVGVGCTFQFTIPSAPRDRR
jgi:signal transduction histidine kinase